jgi:HEAT repeat protein
MASPAFERFRFSFFEDTYSARDGLDTAALAELQGDERIRAEKMLIQYLPDTRGVIGLGELHSRKAERPLIELFEAERAAQNTSTIVYLAKALWQIRPDRRWLAAVVEVLVSADLDMQRMNAALALSIFRDPEAVAALVKALDDPAPLVRHHAARALLAIHGLSDEHAPGRDSQHMTYRVMSDDPARRAEGKRDIVAAIAGQSISGP